MMSGAFTSAVFTVFTAWIVLSREDTPLCIILITEKIRSGLLSVLFTDQNHQSGNLFPYICSR